VKKQLLQEACFGFPTAAVTGKVVPKAGHECTLEKPTRDGKPEQKLIETFGKIFRITVVHVPKVASRTFNYFIL
jgi:hypothetical protein